MRLQRLGVSVKRKNRYREKGHNLCVAIRTGGAAGSEAPTIDLLVILYRPSSLYHDARGYKRRGPARYRINAGVAHAACSIGVYLRCCFCFWLLRGIYLFSSRFPPCPKGCSMGAERVIKGSSAQDHPNQTPRILLFHLLSLQRIGLVCIFNKYLVLFEYFACRLPRSRRCFYILCFTVARKRIEIVFSIVFYQ